MADLPLSKEIRSDYVGGYTAYLFADGHIETDPPGRPKSKEDAQRDRRVEVSKDQALAVLAAERSKLGLPDTELPQDVLRQNADAINGNVTIQLYRSALRKLASAADLSSAPAGQADVLLTTVPLGGRVVGERAGQRVEYDIDSTPLPTEDAEERTTPVRI